MNLVYRYRVKSLNGFLNQQAKAVNFVWNFCNNTQKFAIKWNKRWPTGFDLNKLTAGSSAFINLHSGTINAICEQYVKSRSQKKRPYLRYRGKRSLGWVPFKGRDIRTNGDTFYFYRHAFRVFYSRQLPSGKIHDGSCFSRDSKGNWFLNLVIEVEEPIARTVHSGIGIDLGLKDFATLSNGDKIKNPRYYRRLEEKLGKVQRARKRSQVTAIQAKIANQRRDFLHKESTRIVRQFDYIAVGNVSSSKLIKTNMAKSVTDASWSSFRQMLRYKAIMHGAWFEEVDESFTSRICSSCGCETGPKGIADIGIRDWVCSECGTHHDRDTNSAINILLRSGHRTPVVGIPVF